MLKICQLMSKSCSFYERCEDTPQSKQRESLGKTSPNTLLRSTRDNNSSSPAPVTDRITIICHSLCLLGLYRDISGDISSYFFLEITTERHQDELYVHGSDGYGDHPPTGGFSIWNHGGHCHWNRQGAYKMIGRHSLTSHTIIYIRKWILNM